MKKNISVISMDCAVDRNTHECGILGNKAKE